MSPISNPELSAGVSGSIADTTTGLDPWIRKPNSPDSRWTTMVLSVSKLSYGLFKFGFYSKQNINFF